MNLEKNHVDNISEINLENLQEVKEYYELNDTEFKKIEKLLCQITKTVSRKGQAYFNLVVRVDDQINKKYHFKKTIRLEENDFMHFLRMTERDPEQPVHVLHLPVRFIKGINKNGNEYSHIQVFLSKERAISDFLRNYEITEIEAIGYKIKWFKRLKTIDQEDIIDF